MGKKQLLKLKIDGLYTFSNQYSTVPEGALTKADNIVIDADSIAEPRRGFENDVDNTFGSEGSYANKLFFFNSTLIGHIDDEKLQYYDSGWNDISSQTISQIDDDYRIQTEEAKNNLYIACSKGIQKLENTSSTAQQAGVPKGLTFQLSANSSGTPTVLTDGKSRAYRIVFGYIDDNNNLLLGAPSQREIISNSSGSTVDVDITIDIPYVELAQANPSEVTNKWFYRVYRSNEASSSPDDNLQLVYEAKPTLAQLVAGQIEVTDTLDDSLAGTALYTNPTQEGIENANNVPPLAKTLAYFNNMMFYGNTKTRHNKTITLISAGSINVDDEIEINGTTFTAKSSEDASQNQFKVYDGPSAAQNISDTARSLCRVVNRSTDNTTVYAYYMSGVNDLPGEIFFQKSDFEEDSFTISSDDCGDAFSPSISQDGVTSINDEEKNALYYSKLQEPEAVPRLNVLYVGNARSEILKLIAIRDRLYILKEDGVYDLTGTTPTDLSVRLVDPNVKLLAPETAVTLNNSVIFLSDQGVVKLTDSVQVVSRRIEDEFSSLFIDKDKIKKYAFAVSYETDRKYCIWVPTSDGLSLTSFSNQAFIYNIFTNTWTRWDLKKRHGIIDTINNKMILVNYDKN